MHICFLDMSINVFVLCVAIVGDITPSCGIPKEEKSRREKAAIDEMCNLLGGGVAGNAFVIILIEVFTTYITVSNKMKLQSGL